MDVVEHFEVLRRGRGLLNLETKLVRISCQKGKQMISDCGNNKEEMW